MDEKYATVHVDPVIITEDYKVVLALRAKNMEGGGKWHLPGGQLLYGDTVLEALRRYALKKIGLEIGFYFNSEEESLVTVHTDPKRDRRGHYVALVYLCKIVGGSLRSGENMEDVRFFSKLELENLDVGWDHMEMIQKAYKKLGV